jgi:large subunit ribosomal protein L17
MRHRVHGRRLSRDSSHREALRENLVAELICHGQVVTTEAKARVLRPLAEKLITTAKRGLAQGINNPASLLHARRLAAARISNTRTVENEDGAYEDINVVKKLFDEVAPQYAARPGGYTRLVKLGKRPGDNADMAIVMLIQEG